MIQSGSVFVFDERESGIKRWTDGRVWSPSRILGNFLIYRELDKRAPGEKRLSIASASSSSAAAAAASGDMRQRSFSADTTAMSPDRSRERQLVGSLSDSYKFRKDGLIKKTMSIVVNGVAQHLISYYHPQDVLHGKLRTPSSVPELATLEISPELLIKQNFRIPPMVESTYDPASAGPLTPPESLADRRGNLTAMRSMSVGSLHGHESLGQSTMPSQQHFMYQRMDMDQKSSIYNINMYNSAYPIPSPSSMSSSPSTPMLSPVRQPPFPQHQRHYSTSSLVLPRNYSSSDIMSLPPAQDAPQPLAMNHLGQEASFYANDRRSSLHHQQQSPVETDSHPHLGQLLNPIHPLHSNPPPSQQQSQQQQQQQQTQQEQHQAISHHQQQPQQQDQHHPHPLFDPMAAAAYSAQCNPPTTTSVPIDIKPTTAETTQENFRQRIEQEEKQYGGGGSIGVDGYMHYQHRQQPLSNHQQDLTIPKSFYSHLSLYDNGGELTEGDLGGAGTLMLK